VTAKASWWLKLDRAEKHLDEIDREISTYRDTNPYRAIRDRKQKRHPNLWCYRLSIHPPPDDRVAVIFGDVIHNIRSALEHLAVGISDPKRKGKTKFPILHVDIWAKEGRRYRIRKPDARRSFNSAVKGMTPEAIAIIKRLQPYQSGPRGAVIDPLAMVSSLENADKHRQLVSITPGLKNVVVRVTARGRLFDQIPGEFRQDGAVVAKFGEDFSPPLQDDEVNVDLYGTPVVAVKIAEADWHVDPAQFRHIIDWLRYQVFPELEACRREAPHGEAATRRGPRTARPL
jgi:hypothetical protein